MPISAPQTNSELPKNGATTRLAASSTPSRTAPELSPATVTRRPRPIIPVTALGAPRRLQAVQRDPGPGPVSSRLQVVDALRPSAQVLVELRLARIVGFRREDAVGDRAGDEDVLDAPAAQAVDVAIRVERPSRPGQKQRQLRVADERRCRRLRGDERVVRDVA